MLKLVHDIGPNEIATEWFQEYLEWKVGEANICKVCKCLFDDIKKIIILY